MLRFSFIPAVKGGVFQVFFIAVCFVPLSPLSAWCITFHTNYLQKSFERRFVSSVLGLSHSLCCSENKIPQFLQNYDVEVMVIS